MIVKLLTEHHLEFLSLKGGCRDSSESTHFKMPHCLKSHALAQLFLLVCVSLFVCALVPLPHGAIGWSVICDCSDSLYSLVSCKTNI